MQLSCFCAANQHKGVETGLLGVLASKHLDCPGREVIPIHVRISSYRGHDGQSE